MPDEFNGFIFWTILFSITISPVGLGYFIDGFFTGFETINEHHIILGCFLAMPVWIIALSITSNLVWDWKHEKALYLNARINKAGARGLIMIIAFLSHAVFFWICITLLLTDWIITGYSDLLPILASGQILPGTAISLTLYTAVILGGITYQVYYLFHGFEKSSRLDSDYAEMICTKRPSIQKRLR